MVIIVSSLLDCQQKSKIIDADNNISIEEDMSGIDIKPYPNHPVFSFVYEKKEYVFSFFGKQENVTSVSIKINPEDTQKMISNYPIGLTDEDIILINTELKKSSGLNNTNINYDDIMIIAIAYAEKINDNYIEKTINIIPTAILQSFLVDHLLYVYYLPYYTVKKGDTLSSIALELFGDSSQYKRLFEYNPSLEWPNRYLQRGEKIRIPIDN
jgi:LysM repeat protein